MRPFSWAIRIRKVAKSARKATRKKKREDFARASHSPTCLMDHSPPLKETKHAIHHHSLVWHFAPAIYALGTLCSRPSFLSTSISPLGSSPLEFVSSFGLGFRCCHRSPRPALLCCHWRVAVPQPFAFVLFRMWPLGPPILRPPFPHPHGEAQNVFHAIRISLDNFEFLLQILLFLLRLLTFCPKVLQTLLVDNFLSRTVFAPAQQRPQLLRCLFRCRCLRVVLALCQHFRIAISP